MSENTYSKNAAKCLFHEKNTHFRPDTDSTRG